MKEIFDKLEKEKILDLNKELKKLDIDTVDDADILLLATYIVKNNVPIVRESNQISRSDAEISMTVKEYIKELRNREKIDNDKYDELITYSIMQVIKNIKQGYSFIELVNESYLYVAIFIETYYEKLKKVYSREKIRDIFSFYCAIKLLLMQIKQENEDYNSKISALAYFKIEDEIEKGKNLDEVLEEKNIDIHYYENLKDLYEDVYVEDTENINNYVDMITEQHNEISQNFMFDYIEENILIQYLGLDGKKQNKKEIMNNLRLDEKTFIEIFNNILRKISETEEL